MHTLKNMNLSLKHDDENCILDMKDIVPGSTFELNTIRRIKTILKKVVSTNPEILVNVDEVCDLFVTWMLNLSTNTGMTVNLLKRFHKWVMWHVNTYQYFPENLSSILMTIPFAYQKIKKNSYIDYEIFLEDMNS